MKSKAVRITALVLSLLLLCPLLSLFGSLRVQAQTNEKRFIFSALLSSSGHRYRLDEENPVTLELSSADQSFTAENISTIGDASTNVLYVALTNRSNATTLRVSYEYGANHPVSHYVEQSLIPNLAQKQSFVLHTPHISDALRQISISFIGEDAINGSVELHSFFDVSSYEAPAENEATVESCRYVKDTHTIEIVGKLSYAAMVRYEDETLALFALTPSDEPSYIPNKTPVARMGVSSTFSFSIPVESTEDIYARYVVAAVTQKGERIPLCNPIYPDIDTRQAPDDIGFKGFHTDSLFSVIDSGAELEIVDVYLDRLQSEQNNGILYAGAHSYYYFNEEYIKELDRLVRNLSGSGCNVYLRFLISPDANGYPFVSYTEESEGIVNKGIKVDNEQALLDVHALTDFLTLRYADQANGTITGIIIGRRADQAATYGYVGAMGLDAYVELYAASLNLIAGAARNNIPGLHIVLPVSDAMWSDTVVPENLTGLYFSELFLISLLEALNACVITPPAFSVMLESDSAPDLLVKSENTYGIDRLSAFLSVIEQYAGFYGFLDKSILYSWTPAQTLSDEQLCAAYALQYIGLRLNNRVKSFIVDFSIAEAAGDRSDAKALQYLATYINTYKTASVTASVLNTLGINSFSEIYSTYTENVLYQKQLIRTELDKSHYQSGASPIGSYELWNFSTATETQNWYAGYACSDVSVLNRALNARFASRITSEEYAEIAYHFEEPKDISFAPLMRFSVGLDGVANLPYEVQIRLLGKNFTIVSSVVMTSGGTQELFLDLSSYAFQLQDLRAIRICARPLDHSENEYNFRLHSVAVESTVLSDEELATRLTADSNQSNESEGEKREYTTPIIVTVLIVLVSLAIAAILIIRYHNHRSRRSVKGMQSDEADQEKS